MRGRTSELTAETMELVTRGRPRLMEVALGMVLLGVIFSSIMYGVMLTQTHKYYVRFKQDPILVKLVVSAVFLLNTASMFFVGHAAWFYLVQDGNGFHSIWSLSVELILSIIMSGLSETFLAFRVYKLSGGKRWLLAVLLSFAILHFGSGQVAAIKILLLGSNASLMSAPIPSDLRLASAAVCDTSIAVSLSYFLHKKRTGFKRSDEIINYLIIFSINSGLLTSFTSIASLITYRVIPQTWVYTALCFLLSRLYATTFLCSLNSRQILMSAEHGNDDEKDSHAGKRPNFYKRATQWTVRRSTGRDKTPTQVFIVTETVRDMSPQLLDAAMIRNSSVHIKEVMENSSTSSLGVSSLSGQSNESNT